MKIKSETKVYKRFNFAMLRTKVSTTRTRTSQGHHHYFTIDCIIGINCDIRKQHNDIEFHFRGLNI